MSKHDTEFYTELLRAYFDSANDAIFVLCNELKFLMCNKLMEEWIGHSEFTLTSHNERHPITDLLGDAASIEKFRNSVEQVLAGKPQRLECFINPDSAPQRWLEISMTRVDVEAGDMIIAVARDMTRQREQLAKIHYQSTHDVLTGLPNRVMLQGLLGSCADETDPAAALVVDIPRFRDVNEALGYRTADEILKAVARRIEVTANDYQGTTTGHLTGNRFAVVVSGKTADSIELIADAIHAALSRPMQHAAMELTLGSSIGIAQFPAQVERRSNLLQAAETALHHAKQNMATGIKNFYPELYGAGSERLSLVNDLRSAVDNCRIHVHMQPIVPLQGDGGVRLEALARWKRGGIDVPPDKFIALAELSGHILPVTQLVMEQAIAQSAQLIRDGFVSGIAINLSPHCLMDRIFTERVEALIERCGIPASSLTFEITEGVAMSERMHQYTVQELRSLGVNLSIDDFGTGHSSLCKLRQLPVSELKIDKSFVRDMLVDKGDATIVEASINLAHSLDLKVVAEGIEDDATLACLVQMGCDYAQGFCICPPLPLPDLLKWLKLGSAKSPQTANQ
ncbi:MAG TPA: EAL domain-containing protein [Gammaproteobacteria bacterium]|nr:EAL domain-containing protein [Gammaproteobacteria bacterium]